MRATDIWVYNIIKAGNFRFGKERFNRCRIKAYHSVFSLAKYFYIVYNIYKENEMLPATLHTWWNKIKHFFDFAARRRALYEQWDRLASNGDEEARYRLLMLYQEEGREYYPLAFKWTVVMANKGEDCGVMLQAAEMYQAGDGVPKDDSKALLWFERALSMHIVQGKNSPLSVDASNYIQERIQTLRRNLEH